MMKEGTVIAVLILTAALPAAATTLLVQADGGGAYPTIQAAMDVAAAGDTVLLADGIFTGEGNRDLDPPCCLVLCSESGNPEACVIDCEGDGPAWNDGLSYFGTACALRIEGLTFRRGTVHGGNLTVVNCVFSGSFAPGIQCSSAFGTEYTLVVEDCRFQDNEAVGIVFGAGLLAATGCSFTNNAGGMSLGENSEATLNDCTFTGNEAEHGGAIIAFASDLVCERCTFADNFASNKGGALNLSGDGSLHLIDCQFDGNEAGESGGAADIRVWDYSFLTAERCEFNGNHAQDDGGVFVLEGIPASAAVRFSDCCFAGNHAEQNGGAIEALGMCLLELEDCVFVSNSGHLDGGALCSFSPDMAVTGCVFVDNDARDGAAIYCSSGAQVSVLRSIFAWNRDAVVFCDDTYGDSYASLSCCDVFGNTGGDWVNCLAGQLGFDGNFSADPQFCGIPGSRNFQLQSDSPCAPGNHPAGSDCGQIGALGVGCDETAGQASSWSAVKAMY